MTTMRRGRPVITMLILVVGLLGLAPDAQAAPGLVVSSSRSPNCTVTQTQDDQLVNSFASVFRCQRRPYNGQYIGDMRGVGGVVRADLFRGFNPGCNEAQPPPEMADGYPGWTCSSRHSTATITIQGQNQLYSEGKDRIFAMVHWFGLETVQLEYGVQHATTFFRGGMATTPFVGYQQAVGVYIQAIGGVPGYYNICFGPDGTFYCILSFTNVGYVPNSAPEAFVINNHKSIPGSSRHRLKVDNLIYQDNLDFVWKSWQSTENGMSSVGYAGFQQINGQTYCLRTGDLGPTC